MIRDARIVQIAPLPPGWHYDDHNRAIGFALVEIDTDGGQRTELYYLGADLTIIGAPDEIYYAAHFAADLGTFAEYSGPDWKPNE